MTSEEKFSEREKRVIELLLQGKGNKQIAVSLGVSTRTVEFHLSNIYKKLGVASRTEAVLEISNQRPRKSTGIEQSGDLRKSTVEEAKKSAENGDRLIQLRRQKMKNVVYILTSGVLLILIIVISLLGRQISNLSAPKPQASETTKATETLVATLTRMPTETPTLSYQVLSPAKIEKDNVTFAVSALLMSCSELSFEVDGTFSSDYPTPSAGNDYPFIVKPDGVMLSSSNVLFMRDLHYGGGGGSDENGVHIRGHGDGYFISPPLTPGQKIHLNALINFNDVFGMTNPIPFEIELDAGQCQ